jgi:hypothetical protein
MLDVVFLHHLRRQAVDGILYPRFFRINEDGLTSSESVLAYLVHARVDPLALRLAFSVELSLCTHPLQRAKRSDSGHFEDGKRNKGVILSAVDRLDDLVFRCVEVLLGRFSFNRIVEDRADPGCSKFLYCGFTLFDRLAAAKLLKDG